MPARRSAVPTGRQEAKEGQSVDPLAEKFPNLSPYNYCNSNPINLFDLNGMEWYYMTEEYEDTEEYIDENGKTSWRIVTKTRNVWRWIEDTPEKKIWRGDYNEDGSKKMVMTQGINTNFEWLTQFTMGVDAFYDQYQKMRQENVIGNDHFHHSMANSNAATYGAGGKAAAKLISFVRELFDLIKGDTFNDKWEDEKANNHGRGINPGSIPEAHNSRFDVRRGGSRANVNKTSLSNQTIYEVIYRSMIMRNGL